MDFKQVLATGHKGMMKSSACETVWRWKGLRLKTHIGIIDLGIVLLIAVFFFYACGPMQRIPTISVKMEPGDEIFKLAEKNFWAGSHAKALKIYNTYLSRFPDHHLTANALMRTGFIYAAMQKKCKSPSMLSTLDHQTSP